MTSVQVRDCNAGDGAAWDAYVAAHVRASFFHQFGWREVFERALRHRCHYLLAERDGAVCGVLPLVHVKSLLFGSSLSSLAFCSEAGPLADDEETLIALEAAALERARGLGVGSLEYRLREASGRERPTKHLYHTFSKTILASEEANMQAIRSKQRNIIRKGIKNGLEFRATSLERFYPVYAESVRNLGTPVFPRALFEAIHAAFPDSTEFVEASLEGVAVSGAMNFYHRDSVCPYYWGGTFAARDLKGNDFLAWSILCRAAERGCTLFDFGRSKQGTGAWQWKENLGFEGAPLYYEYELVRDREVPEKNPLNPKYRLFVEGWKHLPLPVSNALGPWLARSLG